MVSREALMHLTSSELNIFRDDLFDVLQYAPNEVDGLLDAVRTGKIEGARYTGDCCCLVGTIARLRDSHHECLSGITPDMSRPIEGFFYPINNGDTPDDNPFSKYVETWILEWQTHHPIPEVTL
jgi:hypothetical protein